MKKEKTASKIGKTDDPKWKGVFNWYGEIKTYYRHASNENMAKARMLKEMAKDVKRPIGLLWRKYDGSENNFEIGRVKV